MKNGLSALLPTLFLVGCQAGAGASLRNTDIGLDKPLDLQESIQIGQTTIPVEVKQTPANGSVNISIWSHGEELESEQYRVTDDEMDLIKASDDTFSPPVPLMHFPASPGQTQSWSGNVQEGQATRSATATIAITQAQLHESGIPFAADKVTINLAINSGSAVPAKRIFEFWFGRGSLVKRVFGSGTTRYGVGITD